MIGTTRPGYPRWHTASAQGPRSLNADAVYAWFAGAGSTRESAAEVEGGAAGACSPSRHRLASSKRAAMLAMIERGCKRFPVSLE